MTDHEFTRPVIFAGGRSLQHLCGGRTQPRNDVWQWFAPPRSGPQVEMLFCWSCLTLFVHEASREAYLEWVAEKYVPTLTDLFDTPVSTRLPTPVNQERHPLIETIRTQSMPTSSEDLYTKLHDLRHTLNPAGRRPLEIPDEVHHLRMALAHALALIASHAVGRP